MAFCFFFFLFTELVRCLNYSFILPLDYLFVKHWFSLQLLDFTVHLCGFRHTKTSVFCMAVSVWNVFFFWFVFNLWINIFHLMVWLHASSVHTLWFFSFFSQWISSAHCDDVVLAIITIDLSKFCHCSPVLHISLSFLSSCLAAQNIYRDSYHFCCYNTRKTASVEKVSIFTLIEWSLISIGIAPK